MADRRTDGIEVVVFPTHAHALLGTRRAVVIAPLFAQEHVLELVHPGVREEQRRVIGRDERRGGDDAVPVACEVVEEALSNLVAGHGTRDCTWSAVGCRQPEGSLAPIVPVFLTWDAPFECAAYGVGRKATPDELRVEAASLRRRGP